MNTKENDENLEDTKENIKKCEKLFNRLNKLREERITNHAETMKTIKELAKLRDEKVFIIPSNWNGVVYHDVVIAKDKITAKDNGIIDSFYDYVDIVDGDGDILENEITEYK